MSCFYEVELLLPARDVCTWMSVSLVSDMSTYVSDVSDCVKDVLVSRTYLDLSVSCHVSVMKLSGCHCQECVCLCRCEGSVKNASGSVNNVVSGSVKNVSGSVKNVSRLHLHFELIGFRFPSPN